MIKEILRINVLVITVFIVVLLQSCTEYKQKAFDPREDLSGFDAGEYPNKSITDGPYVFYENGETILKWIENDQLVEQSISGKNFSLLKENFGIDLKPEWIIPKEETMDFNQEFKDVDRIIAISDIHGQYKLFVKILREYQIIDDGNNWNFGNGHLMIVGDIFDRGPQVNETFWLVYKLEHQAREAGGKVHYLLGNHDEMIINKDFRYVNEKYLNTAKLMNLEYDQLFNENTLIGGWLRTKPVMIQINDILFVHAGISPEFVEQGFKREQVNQIFLNEILGKTKEEIKQDTILNFLKSNKGPIWYRGYFDESLEREQVDEILAYFNVKNIVVGHTSQECIISLYRDRIFGVDSSIKNGKYGEVLIYDKGDFFRGTIKMSVPF